MKKTYVIATIVLLAALSRILPHPYNFSPVTAMALFAGAQLGRKWIAFLLPLLSLLISDLVLSFNGGAYGTYFSNGGFIPVYISFMLVTLLGTGMKKYNWSNVLSSSITASLLFFAVSNLGYWYEGVLYPVTFAGLVQSYVMAIPFYKWTLLGDLCYSSLFFAAFSFIQSRKPELLKA